MTRRELIVYIVCTALAFLGVVVVSDGLTMAMGGLR